MQYAFYHTKCVNTVFLPCELNYRSAEILMLISEWPLFICGQWGVLGE